MEPKDLTLEVLRDIRAEGRKTNERLDKTNERLNETNARLEAMREELSRRIVESELRTATAITDLAGSVREMTTLLREDRDLRGRVERCEKDIAGLKQRLPDA